MISDKINLLSLLASNKINSFDDLKHLIQNPNSIQIESYLLTEKQRNILSRYILQRLLGKTIQFSNNERHMISDIKHKLKILQEKEKETLQKIEEIKLFQQLFMILKS